MMSHILLVEDTLDIGESMQLYLQSSGFAVTRVKNCAEAKQEIQYQTYDCAVLDRMLPDGSGIELCQIIKEIHPAMPIILETARFQIEDKLEWFDVGADDYLVKPFDLRELEIRIKKLIERASWNGAVRYKNKFWNIIIDTDRMEIYDGDKKIHCTANERVALKLLMDPVGEVVSRSTIAEFIRWDEGMRQSDNKLDVLISWIRKKLGHDVVVTAKGVGYKMNMEI